MKADSGRELRQVAFMDFQGRQAVFTGVMVPEPRGEVIGEDYIIVIGNLLAGREVVNDMARAFERYEGDLAWRMVEALKAGRESGDDRRGEKSAALIVVDIEDVEAKIRVDVHETPIEELCRKLK